MKPIIFKTAMVQAILDGRKTETRRLNGLKEINKNPDDWSLQDLSVNPELMRHNEDREEVIFVKKGLIATFEHNELGECFRNIKSRYQVGDILYVRETWLKDAVGYHYRADFDPGMEETVKPRLKWRPSIHMPKEAARIFLRVVDVRVERLQDITEEGAMAEGVVPFKKDPEGDCWSDGLYRTAFQYMWNEMYGWNPNSWDTNPWVWVIKFERVHGLAKTMPLTSV